MLLNELWGKKKLSKRTEKVDNLFFLPLCAMALFIPLIYLFLYLSLKAHWFIGEYAHIEIIYMYTCHGLLALLWLIWNCCNWLSEVHFIEVYKLREQSAFMMDWRDLWLSSVSCWNDLWSYVTNLFFVNLTNNLSFFRITTTATTGFQFPCELVNIFCWII